MSQMLDRLTTLQRHHGAAAAFQWLAARGLQKTMRLEISEISCLDTTRGQAPGGHELNSKFDGRFLTPGEIALFAINPENDLSADFASRAAAGLDYCFGIVDRERLAAYSWYAVRSIEGRHHIGVPMSFPADTAYMYKAYTHPAYRGNALYGIGVSKALQALESRGVRRLITSISRANFASRAGTRRIGFEPLGNVWTLGAGAARIAWTPRAARRLGIQFGNDATVAAR
jgi:hypothetical protein